MKMEHLIAISLIILTGSAALIAVTMCILALNHYPVP